MIVYPDTGRISLSTCHKTVPHTLESLTMIYSDEFNTD